MVSILDPPASTTPPKVLQISASLSRTAHAKTKLHKETSEHESKIVFLSNLKWLGLATSESIKKLNMAGGDLKQDQSKMQYLISDAEKQEKHCA